MTYDEFMEEYRLFRSWGMSEWEITRAFGFSDPKSLQRRLARFERPEQRRG